jgi:hypothetical protein
VRLVPIACSAAAILTLGVGTALLPAASAHAQSRGLGLNLGTLICSGTEDATFSPALTDAQRDTTVTTQDAVGSCVTTDPTISGGEGYTVANKTDASCNILLADADGNTTFIWSNKGYSTFDYTKTTTDLDGEITITETGQIIGGEFEGEIATEVIVLPTLDLTACQSSGISAADGTVVLTILPL